MSWLLASQIVLGVLVAVTTDVLVQQAREQALLASRHELQSLALTLSDQAERAFEEVDLLQSTFMEMVRPERLKTPADFRQMMGAPEVNEQLITHVRLLPQLDIVALIDADGTFVNLNHALPIPRINVADRQYFRTLKADPSQTMIVTEPVVNRLDNEITVGLARRITAINGDFLGVSLGGLKMSYFENLYRTVSNTEDTAIALSRNDGVLFARYPHVSEAIGKSFTAGGIVAQMMESGATSEVVHKVSQVDGVERLIAGHRLTHFPLVVSVSSPVPIILRASREQSLHLIGAAGILELVVVGVGMLTQRQLRSQRLLGEARTAMAEAETARRADQELRIQAVRFGAALSNMSEVLCLFDAADRLVVGSDRLAAMLELPVGSISPGMTIQEMGSLLTDAPDLSADPRSIHSLILHLRESGNRESQALDTRNGGRISVNFAPMDNDGWLVTLEDITRQRLAEARIEHMALHDALTGLANRVLFHSRLGEAMGRSRRGARFAMLYLDLDHFKAVNDTLGHPVGDALLREVTQRLKNAVRSFDTVARLGGDEFAIVQAIDQPADGTALALRLIEALSAPYEFNGNRVIIGTSIGIALVPEDGDNADEIIKNADMALYRSKADGRGRYHFFEDDMNAQMQARRLLDLDLRRAIADGEFRVFYQPLINLASGLVCGFEALVRWQHPERGLVSPADFIPLAEEIGLIIPLGNWVLRQACADAAAWPGDFKVAVNLSPVQFGCHTLVEDVAAALADAGLPARRLELEITETAMLADTDAVLTILHQLRDLGLGIALDDFGTGYSSLSYLQRFPFNKVKIDRSFVMRLEERGDTDVIVAAVIDLCGQLGMVTTAEGVETAEQLDYLALLGCVEAQGYLFSRPCPGGAVAELLATLGGRWGRFPERGQVLPPEQAVQEGG